MRSSFAQRSNSFRSNQRGAVLVEFAVVVLPLLMAFFCFYQIALVSAAHMALRHSANVAVRAAVTRWQKQPKTKFNDQQGQINKAAELALGPWSNPFGGTPAVTVIPAGDGANDEIAVRVKATYTCSVALGKRFVCTGGVVPMEEVAVLTNQGADYTE